MLLYRWIRDILRDAILTLEFKKMDEIDQLDIDWAMGIRQHRPLFGFVCDCRLHRPQSFLIFPCDICFAPCNIINQDCCPSQLNRNGSSLLL